MNSDTDGKDSRAGKKETLDKLTKLKLKIPAFPYERTKNKNLKKRGEKNRKKIETASAAVLGLAWRLNVAKCLRFRLHKQFVYIS